MTLPPEIATVLASYPATARQRIETLRAWVFDEAETAGVGPLSETLKWREPAYMPPRRFGTTLRLAWSARHPDECRLLVHCQTTLVEDWRAQFSDRLAFEGNRAVRLPFEHRLPERDLRQCMAMALTYHKAST